MNCQRRVLHSKKGGKKEETDHNTIIIIIMGKKQLSGAQKRKKRKEREKALEEARAEMERLKLGPTKLWTGLVLHHKEVFVSHVISKLNRTDRFFFSRVNRESWEVLEYAGVNVSKLRYAVRECTSISTSKWMNIREHPNLIPIRLPRRTQAHPDSHYSPSERNIDLSYSISKSHARQKHPYDATPIPSITSSAFQIPPFYHPREKLS